MNDPSSIIAVMEFGATARGDADHYSDRDVFALVEDTEPQQIDAHRRFLAHQLQTDPRSVACYTVTTVNWMIEYGSLFLLHLRLEGRILSDEDGVLREALGSLRPYLGFRRDLIRFQAVLEDVRESISDCGSLDAFDSHVLFGLARNTCMLLSVMAARPTFGRTSVFRVASECFSVPMRAQTYEALQVGHLVYQRGAPLRWENIGANRATAIVGEVQGLIDLAVDECKIRNY